MIQKADGIFYAPQSTGKVVKTVSDGEFRYSVIGLDHGHIYAMVNGLTEAGATLKDVYDPDPAKVNAFIDRFPAPTLSPAPTRFCWIPPYSLWLLQSDLTSGLRWVWLS